MGSWIVLSTTLNIALLALFKLLLKAFLMIYNNIQIISNEIKKMHQTYDIITNENYK